MGTPRGGTWIHQPVLRSAPADAAPAATDRRCASYSRTSDTSHHHDRDRGPPRLAMRWRPVHGFRDPATRRPRIPLPRGGRWSGADVGLRGAVSARPARGVPGHRGKDAGPNRRRVVPPVRPGPAQHTRPIRPSGTSRRKTMPISPNQGSTGGGTTVTITGTNLSGATAVKFGSKLATITANTAHPGHRRLAVRRRHRRRDRHHSGRNQQPAVVLLRRRALQVQPEPRPPVPPRAVTPSPSTAPACPPPPPCHFGANSATPTVVNDSQITVTVPAGAAAGPVGVSVTTAGAPTTACPTPTSTRPPSSPWSPPRARPPAAPR